MPMDSAEYLLASMTLSKILSLELVLNHVVFYCRKWRSWEEARKEQCLSSTNTVSRNRPPQCGTDAIVAKPVSDVRVKF